MSPYDRTGTPPEDQPDPEHRPGVDCAPGGWLHGHTLTDDTPKPCPVCRPHLTDEARHRRLWGHSDPGPTRGHHPTPEQAATETPGHQNPSSTATCRPEQP